MFYRLPAGRRALRWLFIFGAVLLSVDAGAQLSPYGTPLGPHAIVYVGTPTAGPHWSPVDYFNGGEYQGPPIGYTDPFQFTLACSNYWDRNGKPAYFNRYFDAALVVIDKPKPGASLPCPDMSGRDGCLYPQAYWSWDYKEPEAQSAFLVVAQQVAADPDWKLKCTETRDQWVAELLQGTIPHPGWIPPPAYVGGNICPIPPAMPTAKPTAAPPTSTPTRTPTRTPATPATPIPTTTPTPTPPASNVVCFTFTPTPPPTATPLCVTVTPSNRGGR